MTIKNIIFDLGGVVLNIDPTLTVAAFEAHGIANVASRYNFPQQVPLFDKFEIGQIDESAFRNGIRELFGKALNDSQIDKAWNAMLLDFPPARMKTLELVGQQYQCFLLSNTNSIHYRAYTQQLENSFGTKSLATIFRHEHYSHTEGLRKPDPKLFERVLEFNNINASETLFIDDAAINLIGAKEVGINCYHLHISKQELSDMFVEGHLRSDIVENLLPISAK